MGNIKQINFAYQFDKSFAGPIDKDSTWTSYDQALKSELHYNGEIFSVVGDSDSTKDGLYLVTTDEQGNFKYVKQGVGDSNFSPSENIPDTQSTTHGGVSGKTKEDLKDKSMSELMSMILFPPILPEITSPKVELTSEAGPVVDVIEIGSRIRNYCQLSSIQLINDADSTDIKNFIISGDTSLEEATTYVQEDNSSITLVKVNQLYAISNDVVYKSKFTNSSGIQESIKLKVGTCSVERNDTQLILTGDTTNTITNYYGTVNSNTYWFKNTPVWLYIVDGQETTYIAELNKLVIGDVTYSLKFNRPLNKSLLLQDVLKFTNGSYTDVSDANTLKTFSTVSSINIDRADWDYDINSIWYGTQTLESKSNLVNNQWVVDTNTESQLPIIVQFDNSDSGVIKDNQQNILKNTTLGECTTNASGIVNNSQQTINVIVQGAYPCYYNLDIKNNKYSETDFLNARLPLQVVGKNADKGWSNLTSKYGAGNKTNFICPEKYTAEFYVYNPYSKSYEKEASDKWSTASQFKIAGTLFEINNTTYKVYERVADETLTSSVTLQILLKATN